MEIQYSGLLRAARWLFVIALSNGGPPSKHIRPLRNEMKKANELPVNCTEIRVNKIYI